MLSSGRGGKRNSTKAERRLVACRRLLSFPAVLPPDTRPGTLRQRVLDWWIMHDGEGGVDFRVRGERSRPWARGRLMLAVGAALLLLLLLHKAVGLGGGQQILTLALALAAARQTGALDLLDAIPVVTAA